jgi:ATP-dependent DNA helicase DinG
MSVLPPTPADMGFNPAKFPVWRPVQVRNAEDVLNSTTRTTACCMPVGTGKSLAYVAIAKLMQQPTVILTATNNLLAQLHSDFPELPVIKGRGNYECESGYGTCEEGAAAGCEHRGQPQCPYAHAKAEFNAAPIGLTNYAYWLAAGKGEGLAQRKLVIMDEGHDAANVVCDALTVNVTDKDVKLIGAPPPPSAVSLTAFATWADWIKTAYPLAKAKGAVLEKQAGDDKTATKNLIRVRRLTTGLAVLLQASALGESWAVDGGDRTGRGREDSAYWYTLTPVHPGRYTELTLLRGATQVLVYSATITPQALITMGVTDATFLDYDSPFPVLSSPVYYVPTVQLSAKSTAESKRVWADRIDEIIAGRMDRKGIIHTVSYSRAEELMDLCGHSDMFVTHGPGAAQTEKAIRIFCKSTRPCVLVSPSVHTGYNFPGHLAEYQIVAKLPWPDTRSNLMQMRLGLNQPPYAAARFEGEIYRGYLIASNIAQAAGRGMRGEKDMCETFIVDSSMGFFMRGNQRHFPKAFRRTYKQVSRVPVPPKPSLLSRYLAQAG